MNMIYLPKDKEHKFLKGIYVGISSKVYKVKKSKFSLIP
jgi:hypothetical protein